MTSTSTITLPPVTTSRRTTGEPSKSTPLFEDQVRSYRNQQRRAYTTQRALRRVARRLTRRQPFQETLEQEIDPQEELRLSMQERARLVPAEVLYRSRRDGTVNHRVYSHRSEEAILCTDGNQLDRTFIQPESLEALKRSGMQFIHVGLMQVRIQTLHRHDEGTMALVVFRDTRWTNLLITRGLVGRLSNTPNVAFAYEIGNVTDYLASQGVQAIAGRKYSSQELQRQQWVLKPPRVERLPEAPTEVSTRNLIDGSISLRFGNYSTTTTPEVPSYNTEDEETEVNPDEEQLIAVFREDEDWDTLGEPSGKFDYMVKYTAPPSARVRRETIIPTGWGTDDDGELPSQQPPQNNELDDSEDEILGRFQMLAQIGDIEEPLPQKWVEPFLLEDGGEGDENSDEFENREEDYENLDEDDENSDTEAEFDEESEPEERVAVLEEDDLLPYPALRNLLRNEEKVFSASSGVVTSPYRPPQDTAMTPTGYAPATAQASISAPRQPIFEGYTPRRPNFKRYDATEFWQFPSAQAQTGAMFVIPRQIGMFDEVFARWESITKNYVATQGFSDPKDKAEFMENLLGETEKLTWVQWRMNFPEEYQELVNGVDGREGTQNIISQMRRVFTLEDPATGSTAAQDEAYRDLERLSCTNIKDIVPFLNDYARLAAKSGRLFLGAELSEKLWLKMPHDLGSKIKAAYQERHSGNQIGVFPRILFAYKYLEQECKEAAFRRSLKNLSFCSDMPLPGYYGEKKKYGVRKSKTYKGKPHETHARIEKTKQLVRSKRCKCYLCGEEGHFASECPSDRKSTRRLAMYEQLSIPEGMEIVSVDDREEASDAIFSISENEDDEALHHGGAFETIYMFHEGGDNIYWAGKKNGYLPFKRITRDQFQCEHAWEMNKEVATVDLQKCTFCKQETKTRMRLHCPKCKITSCILCSSNYCGQKITPEPLQQAYFPYEKSLMQQQQEYIVYQTAEIKKLQERLAMEEAKEAKIKELEEKLAIAERKIRAYEAQDQLEKERNELAENDRLKEEESLKKTYVTFEEEHKEDEVFIQREGKAHVTGAVVASATNNNCERERPVKGNMLYNMDVEIDIPYIPRFTVKAILDTGATSCCISSDRIPANAVEPNTFEVTFRGINSVQKSSKKLKYGQMRIGGHTFRIPYTYCFEKMELGEIQYVLGCNFIRSMHGGVRLEGNEVTFYKNVTTIQTRTMAPITSSIDEEDDTIQIIEEET
ncbi:hypothetical protein ES332_D07G027800v1 [Gossypium tomentosum]|uniref:CCHC-type domain-containing protein n=1 Tax=Gossypium tomentosum TaxID=34277 RepID=A0A5D2K376_GOSTO|nr:hypothetical protein ES332_D07G027800v1 [Gossypium tomentosum]